ncbi:amphi-Trp domain-containing protein [Halogeometricum limi]|uniref:Amphi-Trp domain-containing protein n=1 Tax=Halogeometricum limi TaxID=555875 RepID=A0A1I6HWJ9_9EURY|nr:amphi-Trp domain-containing protein [Halogeometricum limi]SFR58823.1 amphi-Trp domain-containing protein [Halogeometricum limi]
MPETILFESESPHTREEVAAYLHTVADALGDGRPISLTAGDQSVEMDVPERVTFEVKAEHETETGATTGELSVEFEVAWDEDGTDESQGSLSIE